MKKIFGLLTICLMVFGLCGCIDKANAVSSDDILKLAKEYKTIQYTVKDPSNPPTYEEIADKAKEYLSEKALDTLYKQRAFLMVSKFAKETNTSIELESLSMDKTKENDDGSINCDYTIKLKLNNGQSTKIVEKKAQLTVSKDGKKITRDWDEKINMGGTPL